MKCACALCGRSAAVCVLRELESGRQYVCLDCAGDVDLRLVRAANQVDRAVRGFRGRAA